MKNKLIMFAGSSPGAGKSTLSSFVARQLALQSVAAVWFYEDDVLHLPLFCEVVTAVQNNRPDLIKVLLEAAHNFSEECAASDKLYLTDALFPAFGWLMAAGYSDSAISDFSQALKPILAPLNPLIVYLKCDIPTALARASGARGAEWFNNFIAYMSSWPYARTQPASSTEDVIRYFTRLDTLSQQLLADWPEIIVLDTTDTPLTTYQLLLLEKLGLTPPLEIALPVEQPEVYTGYYTSSVNVAQPTSLTVSLAGGRLRVDTYWPAGCELVAESKTKFTLQGTNHFLEFDLREEGLASGLNYHRAGDTIRYARADKP